ncbi:MAG: LacI family transcriptional regulator [Propionibacteriaceae bacterium]|nr:LacI family transcriptional regulator [Propionibacteriaceae bacterium]
MVTIYDVAKMAGVSPATVSRVFGGQTPVAQAKAQAVREAAAKLEFQPNGNARRLRTSSSDIIAMIVPDVANPYFTEMTRAVEDAARAVGYSVILCNTDDEVDREQDYLRMATREPVAGIIIAPNCQSRLSWAIERRVPVVCVDRRAPHDTCDSVVFDNFSAALGATHMLYDAGYERLGAIIGPEFVETSLPRLQGWTQAVLERTGSQPDPALIKQALQTSEAEGERLALELLSGTEPPDAIFVGNNPLATGALRVLFRKELLPPTIGLVSFGGPPQALFTYPGIIVTHLPQREIGTMAADMLLERINGCTEPARSIVLPVSMNTPCEALVVPVGAQVA